MTSRLCNNASCSFERTAPSNANDKDLLKQPLIIVQDLESPSSSLSSSSSLKEQNTTEIDISKQRVSIRRVLAKSVCFGAFVGLLLQAVTFSAFWVMSQKWGTNTQADDSAPLSNNWTPLYLLLHADIFFCTLTAVLGCVMALMMMMTRQGWSVYMYFMRNKFDNEADGGAPTNSESSVWTTPRFLFVNGIGFRFGFIYGSYGTWVIFKIALLGMSAAAPLLVPLLCPLLVDVVVCCLMIKKCFDWVHDEEPSAAADDDKLEEED